ncbi:MAG: hypothetical protein EU549_04550, partial [Promethearchaeota archaeon]
MQLKTRISRRYPERISYMRDKLIKASFEICTERAKLITQFYKNTKESNPILRFSKAMRYILSNMTLKIWDDEFIIGNRCSKYKATPLYPEVRIDSIELDLDGYDTRAVQPLGLSIKEKTLLKNLVIPFWKNNAETIQERFISKLSPKLKNLMEKLVYIVDTELTNGIGHFFPGHENILTYGINGLYNKTLKKLSFLENMGDMDSDKINFLKSVLIELEGAKIFIERFAILSKEMAEKTDDESRREELREIAKICRRISENPPNSFKEALQLVYFNHLICGLEDGGFAISIGRLDQLLYRFYIEDKKSGKISDDEVLFLIQCFFIKLSTLWNYILSKGVIAGEGPPIAANVVIGGVDKEGNDATNKLSTIILEAYKKLKTVQPTFSVRIHRNTSQDFIKKIGDSIKNGTSIA